TATSQRRRPSGGTIHIEEIQDQVELALMRSGEQKVARDYVIYRESRSQERKRGAVDAPVDAHPSIRIKRADGSMAPLDLGRLNTIITEACEGLEEVDGALIQKETLKNLYDGVEQTDVNTALVMTARTLVEREPNYSYVTARLLIAADGVNSTTARALFGKAFDADTIGFALEVEVPSDTPDTPVRIDFGAADWGYGWDFPKTSGRTIGVGGILRRNGDLKTALATYLRHLDVTTDSPIKGQFLPFGAYRRVPGKGPVLLAGDAAGLVDPITGEGIAYAMKSGQLAAQSAVAAMRSGAPATALPLYRDALRPIHRAISQARMIRPMIFLPALRGGFVAGFRNSSTLRTEYLRLLAGETEYGQITRRTIARIPRLFMRSAFRQTSA
ncbi:MAG: ATP cone domain-containing protein, partial [Rhodobacterales bacterium]